MERAAEKAEDGSHYRNITDLSPRFVPAYTRWGIVLRIGFRVLSSWLFHTSTRQRGVDASHAAQGRSGLPVVVLVCDIRGQIGVDLLAAL